MPGSSEHGVTYCACQLLLRDLLLSAVNHGGPAPGGPHDPPSPSVLGVQDAIPGDTQLSFRAGASATHLMERKGTGEMLQPIQSACHHPRLWFLTTAFLVQGRCDEAMPTGC